MLYKGRCSTICHYGRSKAVMGAMLKELEKRPSRGGDVLRD